MLIMFSLASFMSSLCHFGRVSCSTADFSGARLLILFLRMSRSHSLNRLFVFSPGVFFAASLSAENLLRLILMH